MTVSSRILFDVSRLFIRGSRFSPTGIDRVVMAYARWLLRRPDIDLQPVLTFGDGLLALPRAALSRLVNENEIFVQAAAHEAELDATWTTLERALSLGAGYTAPLRAKPARAQLASRARWHLDIARRAVMQLRPMSNLAGRLYVNVSHTGLHRPRILGRLATRGAPAVIMVHDLIPINFPEYCSPLADARHVRRIDQILDHAQTVITNSATTANELQRYADQTGRRAPPIAIAPLGVEQVFHRHDHRRMTDKPYFVCVGTIEARKNLSFLLAIWRRLAEQMGDATPMLVIVGRRGWENESVIDHLERSSAVIRFVHEVCDLQDLQLARLVHGATALLGPSHAEGYDLPIIEALALGTPVIASDIAVHREFAGQQAVLIDSLDGPGWLAAIGAALERRTRGSRSEAPTWDAHFEQVSRLLLNPDD